MSKFGNVYLEGKVTLFRKKSKKPKEEQLFFCEESAPASRIFGTVQRDEESGTPPAADMGLIGSGFRMNTLCRRGEDFSFESGEPKSPVPAGEKTAAGQVLMDGSPTTPLPY